MNRDVVLRGLLAISIICPALALGAVHAPVLAGFVVVGALVLLLLAFNGRTAMAPRIDWPGYLLFALAAFTALQVVPLPGALVELVSPNAHEIRAGASRPLGLDAPSFMPLTIDVPLTVVELGKLLFYGAVYVAALTWTRRRGLELVTSLVVAAGVAAAFVLLAHKTMMADAIYGLYRPVHASLRPDRLSAPLINENHMAALLCLSATVAVGMAVSAAERSRRVLMIGLSALLGGSLLLTLSRGGIAAFVIAQLLFIFLRLVRRLIAKRTDETSRRQIAWLPLGLALSLALGLFAAQDAIIGEFIHGDHRKMEMLAQGLPLIGRFAAVGVGRGAFWVGFSQVSAWDSAVTFTHAENSVVQILSDWGIVVGGIALVGFALPIARGLVRPPERTRSAAILAALVGFGAHNLVDFNMEIPGVAVVAVALLGALRGASTSGAAPVSGKDAPRWVVIGAAAVTVAVGVLVGTYAWRQNLDREERALHAALVARNNAEFDRAKLASLLRRHPASWYLPFVAGVEAFRAGDDNPLPWFARALEINPDSASAHLYVGRTLLRAGRVDQALIEMRLAARSNPALAAHIARFLVASGEEFGALSRIAIDDGDRHLLWEAIGNELAARGLDVQAEAADLAVLKLDPPHARPIARHARRLAARGRTAEALALADRLVVVETHEATALALRAEILQLAGRSGEALSCLSRALETHPTDTRLLRETAWALARADRRDEALALAGRLKSLAVDSRALAAASILEGELELHGGRLQAAMACLRQAHALVPNDVALLSRIVSLAAKAGDTARELDALRELIILDPGEQKWKTRLAEIENGVIMKSRLEP